MKDFIYNSFPGRVIFGSGTLVRVRDELEQLGATKALILSTLEQTREAELLRDRIGDKAVGIFNGARMHTPTDITEAAMTVVAETGADSVIALGGGSTIGLGKAIAWRTDLPQIVIPTTYAGSEATPILGETANGVKTTRSSPKILPEVIIYDVDLTKTLPLGMTVTSGINAIAHAVEGLYSQQANPVISLIAQEGVRALISSLPRLKSDSRDTRARADALYGAWLCGTTLGAVGMALHHKLCHTLGGTFDLPHAQTHTVILPHALAYNAPYAKNAVSRLSVAMGCDDPALALFDLAKSLDAPTALRDLGMPREGLERVIELTFANPYWNPAPLDRNRLRGCLDRAWEGLPPRPD